MFLLLFLFLAFPKNLLANNLVNDITITDFSSNSDPEWIQITNNTDHDIDLTDWALRDQINDSNNTDGILLDGCLTPGTFQVLTHDSGWLNNGGDTIRLYDQNDQLINALTYQQGTDKTAPDSTNTCTPSSPTPTPDDLIVNPNSNIILNEIMPYSSTEWIEIYNRNNFDVKLTNWTIEDNISNTKNIPDIIIETNSLAIFEFSSLLNNDQSDTLNLYNQDHQLINTYTYPSNNFDLTKSWSNVDGTWCKTNTSKGAVNNSCLSPTSTPTPSPTITPTPTKTLTPTPTPTPKITNTPSPTPDEEEVTFEQESEIEEEGSVLGQSQEKSKDKKNYLPLFFILAGGLLLLSPLIVTTLKKWQLNSKK